MQLFKPVQAANVSADNETTTSSTYEFENDLQD